MAIRLAALREAAGRRSQPMPGSIAEARSTGRKTAFLCHSHRDAELVRGFVTLLSESGWKAYVDWMDADMPERPNRETAIRIQRRIVETDYFFFLATPNSMASRWCPWEIGFADGRKPVESIIVCPTQEGTTVHGSEYLDLYRRTEFSWRQNKLAVWRPGEHDNGVPMSQL